MDVWKVFLKPSKRNHCDDPVVPVPALTAAAAALAEIEVTMLNSVVVDTVLLLGPAMV